LPEPEGATVIEIRTYEGDAPTLSVFTQGVWRRTYAGRMTIPLWDERYFEWQLLAERPGGRDYLVVAYEGARLVGSLLGEAFRFRLRGREFDATMGSWLTVDPDYRGQGLGKRLVAEQRRRHQERGAVFHLGYGYEGAAISMGPAFWKRMGDDTLVLGWVGWWARVLDHAAVSEWDLAWWHRIGSRLLGLVQGPPPSEASPDVRPYRPDDVSACLRLTHQLLNQVDLGYVWTQERLGHQLHFRDVPRTLVAEQDGQVAGFVNFYPLQFLGRHPLAVGLIDLMVMGPLRPAGRIQLLRAALARMRQEGMKLALALRLPGAPGRALLACGFLPLPRELSFLCYRIDRGVPLEEARRLHVHFR
jgi:predicted N-acetyltransferase YhbS